MDPLSRDHILLVLPGDALPEIRDLAARHRRANGPVISLVNRLGGRLEQQLALVPEAYRSQIERGVAQALSAAMAVAGQGDRLPDTGTRGPLVAAMAAGAAGGAGGVPTALAELPVTVTLILHAIRQAARAEGFDPEDPGVRAECIKVFGAGSPLAEDDGINTSFVSARLTLTGPAVQKVIATVAPKLAATLGQKLAAQAVPVIGAVTGAALNAAFLSYFTEVARIRFALLRLSQIHGAEAVLAEFRTAVEAPRLRKGG
ncbi:EcsC family protein [Pseudorhodobacter sp. MZDSW-24AT]|uniref:EcsC family protein n=1 Tax=Pseudorhodobacter sp. MZDSW-24AT TaxID=2052957 RepID=UPI000C1EF269|nr:EcsC family protein [Pseudorhodobacter sp. MZDSW-24AT]PJF10487.1 staphylolytic protease PREPROENZYME LASA [Pseudorhodobacter sp. MZDSW-24AT]